MQGISFDSSSPLVILGKTQCNRTYCKFPYPCASDFECGPIRIMFRPGFFYIKICGAKGGDHKGYEGPGVWTGVGGSGGCSQGKIQFSTRVEAFLYLGGMGMNVRQASPESKPGGFNGGGVTQGGSASGGGGTDIRLSETLLSRIIVAGGGGGSNDNINGGNGGGINGGTMSPPGSGEGGHQTHPGLKPYPGEFGIGGFYSNPFFNEGGGGGSGYFGGARGSGNVAGGGGGSGFVSGMTGCVAVSKDDPNCQLNSSIHFSNYFFVEGSMTNGENPGRGYAEISFIESYPTAFQKRKKSLFHPNVISQLSTVYYVGL